jgi:hypothetical protein
VRIASLHLAVLALAIAGCGDAPPVPAERAAVAGAPGATLTAEDRAVWGTPRADTNEKPFSRKCAKGQRKPLETR